MFKMNIVLALCLILITVAQSKTIHIPSKNYNTIQIGIDTANTGDTVLVAPGTYQENINFRGKSILVTLYYLMNGDSTYIYNTIIDGNNSGTVVTFNSSEDSTSQFIGFTVINGLTQVTDGGGIYCYKSSPVLKNLRINNNSAVHGGGIFCYNSNPYIRDVNIELNNANYDGGGICLWLDSQPYLNNVKILNNTANWFGGGIASDSCDFIFENGIIKGNSAINYEGGGIFLEKSKPSIRNVKIMENATFASRPNSGGGGIYCSDNSKPFLSNVTLVHNSANHAGGGIYCEASSVDFDLNHRCNIYLNDAGVGNDLYADEYLHVAVDTFTVEEPTNYYASPIGHFSFDILNWKISRKNSDLYVSPRGNNENSGLSPEDPLKTIDFALSIINASAQNPRTIFLSAGVYSPSTNGEHYGLYLVDYVTLKGSGPDSTILDGGDVSSILYIDNVSGIMIKDLSLTNPHYAAISCSNSQPILQNLHIYNCTGRYTGSALYCSFNGNPVLKNVLISDNSSIERGIIYAYHSEITLENTTIANNTMPENEGIIYCQSSDLNISNSILWNDADYEIYFYQLDLPSTLNLSYSNIKNGEAGVFLNTNGTLNYAPYNNDKNPVFVDLSNRDYHLHEESPCIDIGNPDSEYSNEPVPNGNRINLGFYGNTDEATSSSKPALIASPNFRYVSPASDTCSFNIEIVGDSLSEWKVSETEDWLSIIGDNTGSGNHKLIIAFNSNYGFFNNARTGIITITSDEARNSPQYVEIRQDGIGIQNAIDSAVDGDTILVPPGVYEGTINFKGKNIALCSYYIIDNDENFISKTVLDGKNQGSVVTFESNEDSSAVLCGFTIIGGFATYGGGIYCKNSNPQLRNLIVTQNNSSNWGGGIYCEYASPELTDLTIFGNSAENSSGGIYFKNTKSNVYRTEISENLVEKGSAGAIRLFNSEINFINCTIVNNSSLYYASTVLDENSYIKFINSILWGNTPKEIYYTDFYSPDTLVISHSLIRKSSINLNNNGQLYWLDGNISGNPLFKDEQNRDLNLQSESPCINSGISFFVWQNDTILNIDSTEYVASAPDIGAYEYASIVSIHQNKNQPTKFILNQNYPNPFNSYTTITYVLPKSEYVKLEVFDITGRLVSKLVNKKQLAGSYIVSFKGLNLSSGVYIYRLNAGNFESKKKMILVR